jgi:hypothetical protein
VIRNKLGQLYHVKYQHHQTPQQNVTHTMIDLIGKRHHSHIILDCSWLVNRSGGSTMSAPSTPIMPALHMLHSSRNTTREAVGAHVREQSTSCARTSNAWRKWSWFIGVDHDVQCVKSEVKITSRSSAVCAYHHVENEEWVVVVLEVQWLVCLRLDRVQCRVQCRQRDKCSWYPYHSCFLMR